MKEIENFEIKLYDIINFYIDKKYRGKFIIDIVWEDFKLFYKGTLLEVFTLQERKRIIDQATTKAWFINLDNLDKIEETIDENKLGILESWVVSLWVLGIIDIVSEEIEPQLERKEVDLFIDILKKNSPVKTGELRRSWRIKFFSGLRAEIENTVWYVWYVNDGTSRIRAQRFIEKSRREFKSRGIREREINKKIEVSYI